MKLFLVFSQRMRKEKKTLIDSVGYLVVDENTLRSKYRGYCKKCHHTFWQRELVENNPGGGFNHLNCLAALADPTPRKLNPKMEWMFAGLDKGKLKKKAKKAILTKENQ